MPHQITAVIWWRNQMNTPWCPPPIFWGLCACIPSNLNSLFTFACWKLICVITALVKVMQRPRVDCCCASMNKVHLECVIYFAGPICFHNRTAKNRTVTWFNQTGLGVFKTLGHLRPMHLHTYVLQNIWINGVSHLNQGFHIKSTRIEY